MRYYMNIVFRIIILEGVQAIFFAVEEIKVKTFETVKKSIN